MNCKLLIEYIDFLNNFAIQMLMVENILILVGKLKGKKPMP